MKKTGIGLLCLSVLLPRGVFAAGPEIKKPLAVPRVIRTLPLYRRLPRVDAAAVPQAPAPSIKTAAAGVPPVLTGFNPAAILGAGPSHSAAAGYSVLTHLWDAGGGDAGDSGGGPNGAEGGPAGGGGELVFKQQQKQKEAVNYNHAERPVLDYRESAFNKDAAQAFGARQFSVSASSAGAALSGRELLGLLMTESAIPLHKDLEPSRLEMERFGKSDSDLRDVLEKERIGVRLYHEWLKEAFHEGLIYRVDDPSRGKSYYGVPQAVRETLGLGSAVPAPSAAAPEPARSALGPAIAALAREMETLPAKDDKFEFMAQAAEAAREAELLQEEDIPEAFWKKARALKSVPASLPAALLTLTEAAYGTPWFEKAGALCRQAAAEKLLDDAALQELLSALKNS